MSSPLNAWDVTSPTALLSDSQNERSCDFISDQRKHNKINFIFKSIFSTIPCHKVRVHIDMFITRLFPKQVYLWGSILEKNRLDTLVGALGLVGRGFGPAGRAGLGWAWGLAVLGFGRAGRAGWVGRVGRAGPLAGLGVVLGVLGALWAWGLAVLALAVGRVGRAGRAGWVGRGVGRGVWPCWARWAGVGVGFGDAGRADWVGRGVQSRKVYYRSTKVDSRSAILSKYTSIL